MAQDQLQQLWSIPGPWSIVPIPQGVNNLTRMIETPRGSYVLRSYRQDRSLEQIRYELGVLKSLQEHDLPFQVPVPIPTISGDLFAVLSGTVVSLCARLPGSPPSSQDTEQARAAGETLAQLGKALRNVSAQVAPDARPFPPSGDFEAWAGMPVDPARLLRELPLTPEERKLILSGVEQITAAAPALYQSLPQQIIHRDYDPSNILMEGRTVTGVLDFEFCGPDLRVLDLTYALSQWPYDFWKTGKEWELIDAFGQGYVRHQPLTAEEREALPLIFRLRATTGLYFHGGRFVQGVETRAELLERIRESLAVDAWLQVHSKELVEHAHNWHS